MSNDVYTKLESITKQLTVEIDVVAARLSNLVLENERLKHENESLRRSQSFPVTACQSVEKPNR